MLINTVNLRVAKTHLISRFRQSAVAALGVMFGISMFVAMVSFMSGSNEMLDDLILNNAAHVHIFNKLKIEQESILDKTPQYDEHMKVVYNTKPKKTKKKIRNSLQIISALEKDERVLGQAPRASAQVFYRYGSIDLNGIVNGIDIEEEQKLFNLHENIISGELESLLTINNGIILGKGLAKLLNADLNNRINVVTSEGAQFQFIVVGLYQSGIAEIDNNTSYVTLATVQKLLQENSDYITDINIKLIDIEMSKEVAEEYALRFETDTEDYYTANAQFEASFVLRNAMSYSVGVALLLVAGFGIYNILNMLIYEKMDDIAILKATGFSNGDVMRIFISQALIIGLIGGILGLALGFLMSYGISKVPFENDAVPTMKYLPVSFDIKYYIIGIVFALVTTFLSGYLPSRRAGKLDPVNIIRGK